MTRIAILADIHGNMPALEAVLEDIARNRVDQVLVGGDLVGRGPQGSEVVQRIRSLDFLSIGGNHEDYLLTFRRGEIPQGWLFQEEWAAARWMAAQLSDEDVAYLESLPFSAKGDGFFLVHGSPVSNREGIGPWTEERKLQRHLDSIEENTLICAHTHRSLVRESSAGLVVNVGSVGMPFNGDRRAQYAILSRDTAQDRWQVELRQVDYDVEEILRIYETTGFLQKGRITAHLLRLELQHAAPFLVPFLEWANAFDYPSDMTQLERFLSEFKPHQSLRAFMEGLPRRS